MDPEPYLEEITTNTVRSGQVRSGHFIVDPEPYLEEITTNTHGMVRSFYSGPRAIPGGNYNKHGQVRSGQVRSFYSGPRAIPGGNYNTHTRSGQVIL